MFLVQMHQGDSRHYGIMASPTQEATAVPWVSTYPKLPATNDELLDFEAGICFSLGL